MRDLKTEIKTMDCQELNDLAEYISMSFLEQKEQKVLFKFIEVRREELDSYIPCIAEIGELKSGEM